MDDIGNFLRSIFGRRRHDEGTYHNDLPRDILDDLPTHQNQPPQGFSFGYHPPGGQEDPYNHHNGHPMPGFGGFFGPGFGGFFGPGFGGFFGPPNVHEEDEEFFGSFDSHPQDMFHEIDELFDRLFQGFPDMDSQGRGLTYPPHDNEPSDDQPLRDRMLKPEEPPGQFLPPDTSTPPGPPSHGFRFPQEDLFGGRRQPFHGDSWNSNIRGDRDLDTELREGKLNLDDVLKPKTPQYHSSSSSMSSSTRILGNGASESRLTKRDSQGNEEVTVTRKLGNQSHSRTYKTDCEGNQEVVEDMTNMDQENLENFEEKWAQATGNRQGWDGPSNLLKPQEPRSLLDSVKDLFFPR